MSWRAWSQASCQLDLDVDASRELELHQRVHGLVVGVDDVEPALVRAGFVLVASVLVDVRRRQDGVALDFGRQRDRAAHLRAGPLGRFDDIAGRTVDPAMIERLAPDPDLLVRLDAHTSELQSLMRISYAVFCLKKKNHKP